MYIFFIAQGPFMFKFFFICTLYYWCNNYKKAKITISKKLIDINRKTIKVQLYSEYLFWTGRHLNIAISSGLGQQKQGQVF